MSLYQAFNEEFSTIVLFGCEVGISIGFCIGLILGLRSVTIRNRSRPGAGIKASVKNALGMGFIFSLIVPLLIVGLKFILDRLLNNYTADRSLSESLVFLVEDFLNVGKPFGLLAGISLGLLYGGSFLVNHYLIRYLLYSSGQISWNLVNFLDYCSERIFLRRVGGGYIFIHRTLLEHFAEIPSPPLKNKKGRLYRRPAVVILDYLIILIVFFIFSGFLYPTFYTRPIAQFYFNRARKIQRSQPEQAYYDFLSATNFESNNVDYLAKLCWIGSRTGHAGDVYPSCEQAAILDPSNGIIHDSLGIVRVLLDDLPGAIDDFGFFISWSKQPTLPQEIYEPLRNERVYWIMELGAGRNPFNEATLRKLLKEEPWP